MNLPSLRNRTAAIALSLGCALALLRCDTQVAGSSVTTGNPTEIQVSFTGDGQPTALTGRVELYGATQIPVPGFQPEPLASFEVEDTKDFTLKASDLEAIPDSLWPVGSVVGDSLVRFNLVAADGARGLLIKDFAWHPISGGFRHTGMKTGDEVGGKALKLSAELEAMTAHAITVHIESLTASHDNYLFIRGSGFVARGDSTAFLFPGLPEGRHQTNFLAIAKPGHGSSGNQDSVSIYDVPVPIDTESRQAVDIGAKVETLPLPSSLKH